MTITQAGYTPEGDVLYMLRLSRIDLAQFDEAVLNAALSEAATRIAEDYLAKHGPEVLAKISPEAVATMAIAQAGAAINATLQRKLPDKVLEVERRTDVHHHYPRRGGWR